MIVGEQGLDGAALRMLLDRQAILDCVVAYCRGVDRMDLDILKRAYHPDATENHNGTVVGTFDDLVDWIWGPYQENLVMSHHVVQNHWCELDGDVAHTETYCTYTEIRSVAPFSRQIGGRYIDRFERRDGRWAIAARVLVQDWIVNAPGEAATFYAPNPAKPLQIPPSRNRQDVSYRRPLTIDG